MFSPLKIALFALLSFATLALGVPTSQGEQPQDLKACIASTNFALEQTVLPLIHITSANATSDCIGPIVDDVVKILFDLVGTLKGLTLSDCGCTGHEILELIATTLKIILEALDVVSGSYSNLGSLLGDLVAVISELLDVVFLLVGGIGFVGQLVFLLISNGCLGLILKLHLGALINVLGLGNLLGLGW